MTSRNTRDKAKPKDAKIGGEQVRSLVEQTRKSTHDLVAAGINRERLAHRLRQIEEHLDQEDHDPVKLRSVLTELQAELVEIRNRLDGSRGPRLMHPVLGTGVPPPR